MYNVLADIFVQLLGQVFAYFVLPIIALALCVEYTIEELSNN